MSHYNLIQGITRRLFEAEDRRLDAVIINLDRENRQLTDAKAHGFLFAGQLYIPQLSTIMIKGRDQAKTPLHDNLCGEMEKFLKDKKQVTDDRSFIIQTLFILLAPCRTEQDKRDALPECIIDCAESLQNLTRDRKAAWSIQNNPRAVRQYEKMLPKLEVYSAARLLY